jgi:hypothetical protein
MAAPLKLTIVRGDRNFDFWYAYSDANLQKLCISYRIPTDGEKKEKAARLCVAWKMGIEPAISSQSADEIRQREYSEKLERPAISAIRDPTTIPDDEWKRREDADRWIDFPAVDHQTLLNYYLKEPFAAPTDFKGFNE